MPVSSFTCAAEAWTPVGHKVPWDQSRLLPVGPIHAAEPQDATAVCSGDPLVPDSSGRSFVPWAPGTCEGCSAALAPRAQEAPSP
ncbi:MAG TPA: hypothetical protein VEW93_07870 [Acidimicrobiales bacterium]|nr:hypothetical protein [Acidimicrobiales bacterium]